MINALKFKKYKYVEMAFVFTGSIYLFSCKPAPANIQERILKAKINHIVVIYLENRSFDNLFTGFPNADTADMAGFLKQSDLEGNEYRTLPEVLESSDADIPVPDRRFSSGLPNKPFLIDKYVPQNQSMPDLLHKYYQNQWQINGGKNNKFVAYSNIGGLVMGYHDMSKSYLWKLAKEYTLCDHFFQAAFGGSFLNHIWLISAQPPVYPNAPDSIKAKNVESAKNFHDGLVTPDNFAINTLDPVWPTDLKKDDPAISPVQTMANIGDRLTDKKISWAWYAGGWNDANDNPKKAGARNGIDFQFHHQPFAFFKTCMKGTNCYRKNLKDRVDLLKDIRAEKLPSVLFYKPVGVMTGHPGYSNPKNAENDIKEITQALMECPLWKDSILIITYDEYGGLWDHVAPPVIDRWGPGTRIPALVVSPFSKKGVVDHTVYNTTSILKLIEKRYDLEPLSERDKSAGDLLNALNFENQ